MAVRARNIDSHRHATLGRNRARISEARRKQTDDDPRVPDDILDGDTMSASDLVDVLEHLTFRHDQLAPLKIDRHARDFLVRLLRPL